MDIEAELRRSGLSMNNAEGILRPDTSSWPLLKTKSDIYTKTKYGKKLSQEVRNYIDNIIKTFIDVNFDTPHQNYDEAPETIGKILWKYDVVGLMKKKDGSEFEYPIELSVPPEYIGKITQYIKRSASEIDAEYIWPTEIILVKCINT